MMSEDYVGGLQDIETYINSIDDGLHKTDLKNARDLYRYLSNNIDGLPRWQEQLKNMGVDLQAPEGQTYKKHGSAGKPELQLDYKSNEGAQNALVSCRS